MNNPIKYRQFIKTADHPEGEFMYWGYGVMPDEAVFVSPVMQSGEPLAPSEQWIGAVDKYGIKIYSGDILRTDHNIGSGWTEEPVHVGIVEYHHTAEWVLTNKPLVQSLPQLLRNRWTVEIIGNIHENPELVA